MAGGEEGEGGMAWGCGRGGRQSLFAFVDKSGPPNAPSILLSKSPFYKIQ